MFSLFVTGTDTGVGKTVVCGLLAGFLRQRGCRVVTQKWIQTGTQTGDNDLATHAHWAGGDDPVWQDYESERGPSAYPLPASPHLAAARVDQPVDLDRIAAAYHHLAGAFESVIVEGSGGLLVPVDGQRLMVDMVQTLDLPVLVVVGNKLGAINHTLLTVEALRTRNLRILGLLFNDDPAGDPVVTADNPGIIAQHTGVPVLGRLPWVLDVAAAQSAFVPIGETLIKESP